MTQKQIEIEAQNYLNGLDLPENADKQLILDNFKNGMALAMMLIKEEKQQWIDEAAEWLRMTMDFFNNGEFNTEKFVNDFKQAMEEL